MAFLDTPVADFSVARRKRAFVGPSFSTHPANPIAVPTTCIEVLAERQQPFGWRVTTRRDTIQDLSRKGPLRHRQRPVIAVGRVSGMGPGCVKTHFVSMGVLERRLSSPRHPPRRYLIGAVRESSFRELESHIRWPTPLRSLWGGFFATTARAGLPQACIAASNGPIPTIRMTRFRL